MGIITLTKQGTANSQAARSEPGAGAPAVFSLEDETLVAAILRYHFSCLDESLTPLPESEARSVSKKILTALASPNKEQLISQILSGLPSD